jgi:bifunctional non-homologous end joining protein LigD
LVDGVPSFGRLQQRLHVEDPAAARRRAREAPAAYLVFDLLSYDGQSLLGRTYDERRALLERLELAGNGYATPPVAREARGADVLAIARERGLEGIVAKRRDSRYVPGQRSGDWVKVKNFRTQEVVIGGWTSGRGARTGDLGALLVGLPTVGGLAYAGKVGTGFSAAARSELLEALAPLAVERSPFVGRLATAEAALAHFVRPELVGEVRYGEWTSDGRLRHPTWRGLRLDKEAGEVLREP